MRPGSGARRCRQDLAKSLQTDTCIGEWHYNKGIKYKSSKVVIDMLVDIVSRNGNLMLNFPLNSKGELDSEELKVLDGVTKWMAVNSEGIYGTRPWKSFGAGPATAASAQGGAAHFNENKRKDLSAADVRFTKKGNTLYAFSMGAAGKEVAFAPLGTKSPEAPGKVQHVELLGYKGSLKFKQDETGLHIEMPTQMPALPPEGVTFKIAGA